MSQLNDSEKPPVGNPLAASGVCTAGTTPLPENAFSSTAGPPTSTLLSKETEENPQLVPPLAPRPLRYRCPTLRGLLWTMWLGGALCVVGIILYVNLHNNTVAKTLRHHLEAESVSPSTDHKPVHFHRARNVLLIVSVVLAAIYIFFFFVGFALIEWLDDSLMADLSSTLTYFESLACLRFESAPTCVCEEREMNCITERQQKFILIPFSDFDVSRSAQMWMSEASVLLREFRSTVPPEVYDDFFSHDERHSGFIADDDGVASVHVACETEEADLNRLRVGSWSARVADESGSALGRLPAGDEASLSATNRSANSMSHHFSASATNSTTRRDRWRFLQPFRTGHRPSLDFPLGASLSLDNSMSATQARARIGDLTIDLKRRRATVLVVHFDGFQMAASTNDKDAKKMSDLFLHLVMRLAKPYNCSVAQCRPDRITLCWNTFGRHHHKDHELLALRCGKELSRSIQQELRNRFPRYTQDDNFSMHTVVVGFTAPVLAGVVSPKRTVRVVHGNYVNLCNELLNLLQYEQSRFVWVDGPPSSLSAAGMPALEDESTSAESMPKPRAMPWTAVPFDTVDDQFGSRHRLHEISDAYTLEDAKAHAEAYELFAQGNFSESLRLFMRLAPEHKNGEHKDVEKELNPIAVRLRQLSAYYVIKNDPSMPLSRPFPDWEVVPGDDLADEDSTHPANSTNLESPSSSVITPTPTVTASTRVPPLARPARHRKSDVEDLKEAIVNATKVRRSESELLTAPQTPRDEARGQMSSANGSPMPNPNVPTAAENPLLSSAAFSPLYTTLPPSAGGTTVPPTPVDAACAVVVASGEEDRRPHIAREFEDKKHLRFLLSPRRLGSTNSSEVFIGLSFTGQQVAIKSIRLIMESADSKPMTAVNRRRAARKGNLPLNNTKIDIDEVTREVQVLSTIRHDHIVGYITSVVVNDNLLIVMEYVSGGSLREVMRAFKPSVEQTRMYLNQILRGLKYLHKKNIVHCDIKPENVLVSISGPCKLTDFGISRQISKASSAVRAEGTPCYMAPEAAEGNAELKSDIWSFGIMMVELVTGTRPWARELHPLAMRAQLRQGTITPEIQGEVTEEVRDIFNLCTQRTPADRPSAEQLLRMPFFAPRQRRSSVNKESSRRNGSTSQAVTPASDSFTPVPSSIAEAL